MTPVLETSGLTRNFGGVAAVADLSFSVEEGTVLGVIGPNGAGKSTLINLITGHLDGREVARGAHLPGRQAVSQPDRS